MKNYQQIIISVIMLLWNYLASAQEISISGVICDEATKLPISNVHIYLDGTSIQTITNSSGRFELITKSVINTKMVLHHLTYETATVANPFTGLPDTLFMQEQIQLLNEVTVSADRFSRKQKLQAFREQFLGNSRAGRSCTIINEDDLQIYVNMQTQKLFAFSDKPIEVINNYLGYKISFILVNFWIQYVNEFRKDEANNNIFFNLTNDYVQDVFLSVISSYTDLVPDRNNIQQRRVNIYEMSPNFFFKSFANEALTENKFVLYNRTVSSAGANPLTGTVQIDHHQYFAIHDTLTQKLIHVIPDTDLYKADGHHADQPLSGILTILNQRNKSNPSAIYFMTDSFLVDRYGNIDRIDKIWFSGQMGTYRAGDMLPIDYEP